MPSFTDELFEDFGAVTLDEFFGEAIVFRRVTSVSDSFTATWFDQAFKIAGEDGSPVSFSVRTFEFLKSLCVIDSVSITPRERDRIELNGETFEVLNNELGGGIPGVEEVSGGYRWRVHTKRVA